jgi:hypothetical protein
MTIEAELAAVWSTLVLTVGVYVPAAAFVIPAIVNVAFVPAASVHEAPVSVITTVLLLPGLVRPHVTKPAVGVIVGAAGTVVPAGSTTVIVSPAASAPVVGGGPATAAEAVKVVV